MREVTQEEINLIHKKLLELLLCFKSICEKENIWYSMAFGSVLGAIRHNGFIPWDTDADVVIWLPDVKRFREAFYKHKPFGIALSDYDNNPMCLQSHDMLYFEEKQIVEGIHLDIYPLVGAPSEKYKQQFFTKYTHYADKIVRSKYKNINDCKKKNRIAVSIVKFIEYFIPDNILKANIKSRETKYDFKTSEYFTVLANDGGWKECIPKYVLEQTIDHYFEGVLFKIPLYWDEYLTRIYGDYMTPKKY